MSIRHGGHPLRRPLFFTLRRKGCASAKTTSGAPGITGSGLRGSALGLGRQNSDGKPCSGVRGGQKASTDFPQQADARLPTLHGKGKTLFRTLFSPCKF